VALESHPGRQRRRVMGNATIWFGDDGHGGPQHQTFTSGTKVYTVPICPDGLDYSEIGAADCLRGQVIRAFFWLLRIWPAR
jgi:hypothetical protein